MAGLFIDERICDDRSIRPLVAQVSMRRLDTIKLVLSRELVPVKRAGPAVIGSLAVAMTLPTSIYRL